MLATNSNHASHPADKVLEISPPKFEIDDYALRALEETEEFYQKKYSESEQGNPKEYLVREGLLGKIAELSQRLNSTGGIKDVIRLLLSNSTIYACLIKKALTEDNVQDDDSAGLYSSVMRSIEQLPRRYFLAQVVNKVISAKRVRLKESSKQWQGMAHRQVHEDYAHLQDAIAIIKSEEIVNHFGGRRKSMWNVIEQVAKEDLRMNIQTAALR
ncbi:MAG: hypothetical protein AAGA80_26040 [Cyanobacteria bacterium P01_F01_bin.143]